MGLYSTCVAEGVSPNIEYADNVRKPVLYMNKELP